MIASVRPTYSFPETLVFSVVYFTGFEPYCFPGLKDIQRMNDVSDGMKLSSGFPNFPNKQQDRDQR